jgi:hypothetical protein
MGGVSIVLYVVLNFVSHGFAIVDAVTCCGIFIAAYYGLTGFACTWYYRRNLTSSVRNFFMQGLLPLLGGLILYGAGIYSLWEDWDFNTGNSVTSWTMPFYPHWHIGGVFVIAFLSMLAGAIFWIYLRIRQPAFFRKQTLTRATPTLVPDN